MQNITENLTKLISQITQMEMDNKKLNEDIREIEKEKAEGYKKFDTDTHILVEREKLDDLVDRADTIVSDADSSASNCETIEDEVSNAKYYAVECSSVAYDLRDKLEELLKPKEEENQPKEEEITKVVVNVNKSN